MTYYFFLNRRKYTEDDVESLIDKLVGVATEINVLGLKKANGAFLVPDVLLRIVSSSKLQSITFRVDESDPDKVREDVSNNDDEDSSDTFETVGDLVSVAQRDSVSVAFAQYIDYEVDDEIPYYATLGSAEMETLLEEIFHLSSDADITYKGDKLVPAIVEASVVSDANLSYSYKFDLENDAVIESMDALTLDISKKYNLSTLLNGVRRLVINDRTTMSYELIFLLSGLLEDDERKYSDLYYFDVSNLSKLHMHDSQSTLADLSQEHTDVTKEDKYDALEGFWQKFQALTGAVPICVTSGDREKWQGETPKLHLTFETSAILDNHLVTQRSIGDGDVLEWLSSTEETLMDSEDASSLFVKRVVNFKQAMLNDGVDALQWILDRSASLKPNIYNESINANIEKLLSMLSNNTSALVLREQFITMLSDHVQLLRSLFDNMKVENVDDNDETDLISAFDASVSASSKMPLSLTRFDQNFIDYEVEKLSNWRVMRAVLYILATIITDGDQNFSDPYSSASPWTKAPSATEAPDLNEGKLDYVAAQVAKALNTQVDATDTLRTWYGRMVTTVTSDLARLERYVEDDSNDELSILFYRVMLRSYVRAVLHGAPKTELKLVHESGQLSAWYRSSSVMPLVKLDSSTDILNVYSGTSPNNAISVGALQMLYGAPLDGTSATDVWKKTRFIDKLHIDQYDIQGDDVTFDTTMLAKGLWVMRAHVMVLDLDNLSGTASPVFSAANVRLLSTLNSPCRGLLKSALLRAISDAETLSDSDRDTYYGVNFATLYEMIAAINSMDVGVSGGVGENDLSQIESRFEALRRTVSTLQTKITRVKALSEANKASIESLGGTTSNPLSSDDVDGTSTTMGSMMGNVPIGSMTIFTPLEMFIDFVQKTIAMIWNALVASFNTTNDK